MKNELVIDSCILAGVDTQELMRRQLAHKLENNEEFVIGGRNGNVMDQNSPTGRLVEPGRLAAYQWYELYPELWETEKEAMRQFWPDFTWGKWQDGRLYWEGFIQPGVYGNGQQKYYVMAIYNRDFPRKTLGGAVHVIPIKPSINEIEQYLGASLHHVLPDNVDGRYLCTTTVEDMHGLDDGYYTTAAQTLGWATKWFSALELVMSGNMSLRTFNDPVGI